MESELLSLEGRLRRDGIRRGVRRLLRIRVGYWLIPQPEESSWGDSKAINKVNLEKEIIGYKPRINTNGDAKNMNIYLNRSSKDKLIPTKTGLSEGYLPMGAPLLDFLTVDV